MIRATTPKHIFIFDIDPSSFDRILITYEQDGRIILEKDESDLTLETKTDPETGDTEYVAWVRLTQEETARFHSEKKPAGKCADRHTQVTVQVRALTTSGEALASKMYPVDVFDVLNDEVLE